MILSFLVRFIYNSLILIKNRNCKDYSFITFGLEAKMPRNPPWFYWIVYLEDIVFCNYYIKYMLNIQLIFIEHWNHDYSTSDCQLNL